MRSLEEMKQLVGLAVMFPEALEAFEIDASDFLDPELGRAFEFVRSAAQAGKPVANGRWLAGELKAAKLLDALGGIPGLGEIVASVPDAANVAFCVGEVQKASALQRLRVLSRELETSCDRKDADPEKLIQRIESQARAIGAIRQSSTVSYQEAARRALERCKAQASGEKSAAIKTGLSGIDDSVGGMYPGELVILAARPSIGKSALAFQLAERAAKHGGTLFVSLEMQAEDLAARSLAGELECEIRELRAGAVYPEQLKLAEAFVDSLKGVPLEIFYARSCTVAKVRALARMMQAKPEGLRLIVVDYIGLMQSADRRKPRWEQVSEISSDLKSLALELGVPVLAACQLSRDAEGNAPTLNQLRDSGAIEQDADQVWLLHRESRDATSASLNVAKNRNGSCGAVGLGFDPTAAKFFEINSLEYEFE
jgi:replicative DNA helicase